MHIIYIDLHKIDMQFFEIEITLPDQAKHFINRVPSSYFFLIPESCFESKWISTSIHKDCEGINEHRKIWDQALEFFFRAFYLPKSQLSNKDKGPTVLKDISTRFPLK